MLFNSYEFLFLFLPITVAVFFVLGRFQQKGTALCWLVLASLFFYGYWNPSYLALIVTSMLANFYLGKWVAVGHANPWLSRRSILLVGIALNLAALGYFKYANFFVDNLNFVFGSSFHLENIILPLAISFFTFQQIAYLVDAYRGEAREYSFLHYSLFVTFFPQLIAGPIVHHKEMLPQFADRAIFSPSARCMALGVTWIAIGLFKKVELADSLMEYSNRVFAAADTGVEIWFLEAWAGALAYTFQLYFDFSGYVDMAMGSAMLIGIRLPTNFNSPYKSLNIIEFWRCWHMTLSRFLKDYLYIALGGNRHGQFKRYRNLALTMLLGGLWHGAAWTFVAWGALHGLYLVINHGWLALRARFELSDTHFGIPGRVLAWSTTFVAVVIGWVFFRAETFAGASNLLASMAGFNLSALPEQFAGRLSGYEQTLVNAGFTFDGRLVISLREWLAGATLIAASFVIVLALPNTGSLFGTLAHPTTRWKPDGRWAAFASLVLVLGITDLGKVSEFLYFNF